MDEVDGRTGRALARQNRTNWAIERRDPQLFVVRSSDSCCESLAGHAAADYESPPQPFESARALVALLAGRTCLEEIVVGEYALAVAGGRRTVTLEAAR
jgi:hypothetical protein